MFAFMTPFNVVMLGFWWAGWTQLRRACFKPATAGGVRIITELKQTRARLTAWSPLATALATIALLAFCSIFVIGFFAGGFHPSMRTMIMTWSVILSGGLAVCVWHTFQVLSGKYDLIIDELSGTIEVPIGQGRKSRRRVPLSSVQGLYVEKIQAASSDGEQPNVRYAPTLTVQGATPVTEPLRLVEWFDEEKARQFVQWLREKLPERPAPSRPLVGKF
jgi:Na+/melibiose symporter-like transporter